MSGQKINSSRYCLGWLNRELKLLLVFFGLISFSNFIFSNNTSALFVPILSASVDNAAASVNGNQVINSTNKTTEIPLNLTVNTNNKTGYTATLNSETDETALVNNDSSNGTKINSISANLPLNNLPNNTWGYKFGASTNYAPIPALSTPAQILQTTGKTNGNESNQLSIGMKLADNLESGNYTNKLILSFVSNPYVTRSALVSGRTFNSIIRDLQTSAGNIKHIRRSSTPPPSNQATRTVSDTTNPESDADTFVWLDKNADNTLYYYSEANKILLNRDSSGMFWTIEEVTDIDVSTFDTSAVENMYDMFSNTHNLTSLDLSNFDTQNVTVMKDMFYNTYKLKTINLSSFDTRNVADMRGMFKDSRTLEALDLSNFDTSKATSMTEMFSGASSLTSLNISNFNTSNVTDMASMFAKTTSLKNLNLVSFNTEKVRNMSVMFYGSDSLTSLDLSSFNTKNVTNISYMFFGMDKITTINIVNFNTQNVENISYCLREIKKISTETVEKKIQEWSLSGILGVLNNDFNTDKLLQSENIFMNRYQLRGGAGSFLANPSDADKTWLRIDNPANSRPGYFTRKP